MSLRLHKRGNVWHIQGKVYLGNDSITVRQTTNRHSKREAEEVKQRIHEEAMRQLKGGGQSSIPWSVACTNFVLADDRNKTDILHIEQLTRQFRNQPINTITTDDWKRYCLNYLKGCKPSYYNRVRAVISNVLGYSGIIVTANIKDRTNLYLPKRKVKQRRIMFLSYEQQEVLLDSYPWYLKSWAIALAYHGLRRQESRLLERHDIKMNERLIQIREAISKDGERFIPMHPRLHQALTDYPPTHPRFVFTNSRGQPYSADGMKQAHSTALANANARLTELGLPNIPHFTIHDWRHHWASQIMMQGGDVESLRELGGWSDLKMVQKYATISKEHKFNTLLKLR